MTPLLLETGIMSSDEDQPVVADLTVGYDREMRICARMEVTRYDSGEPRLLECTEVRVRSRHDSQLLARDAGCEFEKLPEAIAYELEEWAYMLNPSVGQVRDCLKEITDLFTACGCQFTVRRADR